MTARYQVGISARGARELRKLDEKARGAVLNGLEALASQPRLGKPLLGRLEGLWSLRRGDYRVVYRIDDPTQRVEVVHIAHRRDVYRRR